MNKKVVIASDSTCDLNRELLERYQIKILPLGVSLGSNQYRDGVDIDPDSIYSHNEQTGELPKTSAVNIAEFSDFFCPANPGGQRCGAVYHQRRDVLYLYERQAGGRRI